LIEPPLLLMESDKRLIILRLTEGLGMGAATDMGGNEEGEDDVMVMDLIGLISNRFIVRLKAECSFGIEVVLLEDEEDESLDKEDKECCHEVEER
jgi:hypothetical protein